MAWGCVGRCGSADATDGGRRKRIPRGKTDAERIMEENGVRVVGEPYLEHT